MHIELVTTAQDYALLRRLFEEYQRHIQVDLCFQDFAQELQTLDRLYASPSGAALIVLADDTEAASAMGCVAIKPLAEDICEMKRLYVRPQFQGRGVGRALADAIIVQAKALGYRRMRLDTLSSMQTAQQLYRSLGFHHIAPYTLNPHACTQFLELNLSDTAPSNNL